MIGEVKGKGYSEALQYVCKMTRKTSIEIADDSEESSSLESLPQSGAFFWNRIFDEIDIDSDGVVSKAEFEKYITETQGEAKDSSADGESSPGPAYSARSGIARSLLIVLQRINSKDTAGAADIEQNGDSSTVQIKAAADQIFSVLDTDGDGTVKVNELADAKAQFLKRIQNSMDRLHQMELTEAFLNMLEAAGSLGCRGGVLAKQSSPSVAQTASGEADGIFKKIDANLDGEISRDELTKALSKARENIVRTSSDKK